MNDLATGLGQIWNTILDALSKIVAPDWGALVALIPLAIAPLVLFYLVATGGIWTLAELVRPRPKVRSVEGPRPAERDEAGDALFPAGQPFDAATAMIYPAGETRSDAGRPLSVICPMCRVERSAELSTCGNCGLVLRIKAPMQLTRPAAPPPGGAAAA